MGWVSVGAVAAGSELEVHSKGALALCISRFTSTTKKQEENKPKYPRNDQRTVIQTKKTRAE